MGDAGTALRGPSANDPPFNRRDGITSPIRPVELGGAPVLALRRRDAARALGLSLRKLDELAAGRHIRFVKVGKCVLYPVAALQAWLDAAAGGAGR